MNAAALRQPPSSESVVLITPRLRFIVHQENIPRWRTLANISVMRRQEMRFQRRSRVGGITAALMLCASFFQLCLDSLFDLLHLGIAVDVSVAVLLWMHYFSAHVHLKKSRCAWSSFARHFDFARKLVLKDGFQAFVFGAVPSGAAIDNVDLHHCYST